MEHYYFVVEGAHDVATIGKLLELVDIKQNRKADEIAGIWRNNLIPEKFPFEANKLDRITPIPSFYQSDSISVAIQVAGGDSKIINALDLAMSNLRISALKKIDGIAIFCDADNDKAAEKKEFLFDLIDNTIDICFDKDFFVGNSGKIRGVEIKSGFYVFPDDKNDGRLENLLLECAELEYNDLLVKSRSYIDEIDSRYKSRWSVSDKDKVLIGSITNILKPGKSNQVSIHDNNWINENTVKNTNSLNQLYNFILDFISYH